MVPHPPKGEESNSSLDHGLAHPHQGGGEGRVEGRAEEERVVEDAPHCDEAREEHQELVIWGERGGAGENTES